MIIPKDMSGSILKESGRLFAGLMLMILAAVAYAQHPTHLPRRDPEPVGFFESTENLIFYVVIPLLIVIIFFVWKAHRKDK
jgi:hypothetical protein